MTRSHVPWPAAVLATAIAACGSQGAATSGGHEDASTSGDAAKGGASGDGGSGDGAVPAGDAAPSTVGKIEHVILVMQENRSFDHYFGMYPGAAGFTLDAHGTPTNCNPDPHLDGGCVPVFHDSTDANSGGPHSAVAFDTCLDNGAMDGFIKNAEGAKTDCADPQDPACSNGKLVDVMGYKTGADIPNYWAYAGAFTLLDHHFESDASWSWPMHQYMVSEWAALCTSADPMSCTSNIGPSQPNASGFYSWTPLTYLLDTKKVSWRYYLAQGTTPDCDDDEQECPPTTQLAAVPSIWNPLPFFEVVKDAGEQSTNVVTLDHFLQRRGCGDAACRLVDRALRRGERASAEPRERGAGVRDVDRERRHAGPDALGQHGHLRLLGRLGRVLRPRAAHQGRRERLRLPDAWPRHQRVGQAEPYRPPATELRRLCEVHRGHVSIGRPDRPPDRRASGFAPQRARGLAHRG